MKRVDEISWYLRPAFWLYGKAVGYLFFYYCKLVDYTSKKRITGTITDTETPVIYCIWHEDLILYFSQYHHVSKQVWMNHPAWYMKPVHEFLHLTGVEHICLGSSGNNGKAALQQVIQHLHAGYSTTVACDGPAGPPFVVKPGVLLMAQQSRLPIIPIRFHTSSGIRLGGWDRKKLPLPLGTLTIEYMPKIFVNLNDLEQQSALLAKSLCN